MADAKLRFMYVSVGYRGPRGDAGMWRDCGLGTRLRAGHVWGAGGVFPGKRVWISATREYIRPYFVGDAAFPLRPYMITPYEGLLSAEEQTFNKWLSRNRVVVERAFGLLTARWRVLQKGLEFPLGTSRLVILLCFVLHNFCIDEGVSCAFPRSEVETAVGSIALNGLLDDTLCVL